MSANFSVNFIINEQTQTRVIRLTDTSTGFTLSKGIFSVIFPDGSTRIKSDINNPDITTSGAHIDIPLVLDSNGVITGNYSVSFVALGTNNQEYTFSRNNFDFNWKKPTNKLRNESDSVIPEVKFKDYNSYGTIGSFQGSPIVQLTCAFPSTSEVAASNPLSTTDSMLDVVSGGKYYEGVYNPVSAVNVNYTHINSAWLTVTYVEQFTKQFIIKKCPNQAELVQKMNNYRAVIEGYKEKNDDRFNLLSEQYDLVVALYSHVISRFETGTTDGSEGQLRELLSILEPYDTNYQYQATRMLPFELATNLTNSFNISDGTNVDAIILGQTLNFASQNAAFNIAVSSNIVSFNPIFGNTASSFAQGNDARFHNAVSLGTPNGLSLSNQVISLATATASSAGAMSSADKTKLDGIAPNAQIGTVTSVGLSAPSAFSVSNSPITGSGTLVISAAGTPSQYITGAGSLATLNTTVVAEGTNLYYTDARFDARLGTRTTTDLAEGTNLYFTNARARSAISVSGSLAYNSSTGVISYTTPAETDPVFLASPASGISNTNISNWNTAYGWGNHASVGYLTSINSSQVVAALGFTPENSANKGVANGYASLDSNGLVPSTQLPSYVDDVLEYANLSAFPTTGTSGKIYVALNDNKTYRWSGSIYVEISPTVGTIWGGIGGALANQTDLQSALDSKQWNITLTNTGNSGAATFISNTLNIPTYTLSGLGGITASFLSAGAGISYDSSTGVIASTITQYTDALARAAISVSATGLTYNSTTGAISLTSGYVIPTTASAANWDSAYAFTSVFPSQTSNAGKYLTTNGTSLSWATLSGFLPAGGTEGQILAKVDGTNYNTTWIDNFASQIKHDVKLGEAMSAGTAVYVQTSNGTNMIVFKASYNAEALSSKTLGIVQQGGILNDIVKVVTEGLLAGIDTSAATIGDPVWLGANGQLLFGIANKPYAPYHMVSLGIVTRVHAENGEIFVKVQNGYELDELHDVSIISKANNQGIFYDSTSGLWKNKTIAQVLGYTPYDASNPNGYISSYTETDPTVGSHIKAITTTNISNWNTAYGWGNHASAGYLTSFTETDPTVGSHIKAITTTNISNWNTAYGWGNHATSGYLTGITSNQVLNALGYTPVPSTRTITINGTPYDLSADRSWTISAGSSSLSLLTDVVLGTLSNNQLLKYDTATSKWINWTPNYLTGNQSISISGDATGSGTTSIALTLANSGVTAGSYGSSSAIPVITVDAKGRVTSLSTSAVSIVSALSGLSDVAIATPANGQLLQYNSTSSKWVNWTPNYLTGNQSITLSGDATGSGATSIAVTLANSGVTAGTYTKVTVDAKGRVTSGASLASGDLPTYTGTLTSSQVTTALGYTPYNSSNPNGYITSSADISGYSARLFSSDVRTIAPNSHPAYRITAGFTSWNNNNGSPYADYIHFRSYSDSSGGNDNLLMFRKDALGIRIWQQTFGSATAYSSYKDIAWTDGTNASGTWNISISGNAATASSVAWTNVSGRPTAVSSFTNDSGYITSSSVGNGTLTMNVSGVGLSGSQTFTANQSTAATFTVTSNATSANTASTIVARDASGNFTATNITATGGGANGVNTGIISRDITAARSASTGVIYLGSDGNHYVYFDGTNYIMPSGGLTLGGNTVITSGSIGSQSVNYATTAGSANSVAWTNVSGRPTAVSSFTNDSGYITSSGSITGSAGSVAWGNITGRPTWMTSASLIATHSNANDWQNSGFYENGGGGSNWPSATWYNSINVRHSNQGNYHGFQVAMSYYDNLLWFRSYQGSGTFQSWVYAISSANIGSQSVNYATSAGSANSVAWTNVSGRPTALSSFTNDSGYITSGGRAYPRRSDGGDLNFYWSGQSGQPSWLWGGNDGANMYVYNPSNFSVNYANSAGSASSATTSSQVTINYNNDSNSTYQMLWGSGNYVYGTAGIYCNPNSDTLYATQFIENSSIRFKENIVNLEDSLEKVLKMRGVQYNKIGTNYTQIGVIAEEMNEILPDVVNFSPNGEVEGVAYARLTAVLIEAIKEQQKQIEQLTNMLNK